MTDADVPADLRRLWRLPASSRLGRPAELDVDRVVGAAVDLADQDGLDGVTLQKVAQTLGVTKMSLYRYVGSKGELAELMFDHAIGPAPQPGADVGWRDGVRQWAAAVRTRYAEHPWLADMPITGPPRGPNGISWTDAMLRVLRDTGLDLGTQLGVLNVVSGHLRNAIVLTRQFEGSTGVSQSQAERDYGRALAALVDAERFPDAARLFASNVFEPAGEPPDDIDFGLELILDGVAAAIDATR
ncbi:TetR/AcrR family transcriptional regulator [Saccharomonospora cyanea]|uniref:Transcriptional regulator n=1 Tax=Saccharomonospora cyanea NA-134 TaxID=882082 RepID=H5XQA7_9PSEU|nr:TetR/AcrR family transcriptional regulator C-terminal domain-containing protein [Saccharomonospora cyanea]EHR63840.1 transcriptional regulator [Saccharomonospora cyanea NA-134]